MNLRGNNNKIPYNTQLFGVITVEFELSDTSQHRLNFFGSFDKKKKSIFFY